MSAQTSWSDPVRIPEAASPARSASNGASLLRLGGACAALLGLSYVLLGVAHLLVPAAQQGSASIRYFESLARNPTPLRLQYAIAALGAVLGLAVVPAVASLVRKVDEGWARWTGTIALLGFAAVTIDSLRVLAFEPTRAATFVVAPLATKAAILADDSLLYLDVQGWLGFGGVGLWVLVTSLLALRGRLLPRHACYLGVAVSLLYWLVVAGFVLNNDALFTVAAVLGGFVAGPIWFIWLGLRLRRAATEAGEATVDQHQQHQ